MGFVNSIAQRVAGVFGIVQQYNSDWYPKKEKEVPKRYHKYLKEADKKNIYGDLLDNDSVDEDIETDTNGESNDSDDTDGESNDNTDFTGNEE